MNQTYRPINRVSPMEMTIINSIIRVLNTDCQPYCGIRILIHYS